MLWADFGAIDFLTADQAKFIASTYQIVSLEKCFAQQVQKVYTEDAFAQTALQLKALNPKVKILFYFHMTVDISGPSFPPCYAAGNTFLQHPDWWLRDDNDQPVMNGPFLFHNLTHPDVVRYMVDTPIGVLQANLPLMDGIFSDGTLAGPYTGVSEDRVRAENEGINNVALATTLAMHAVKSGTQVIGNGLAQYHQANPDFPADDGMGMLPYMDGVCVEHFGAFEMTNPDNCSLIPQLTFEMLNNIAAASALNKTILVKGWPGPVSVPIDALGPEWPASCKATAGATRIERAQQAGEWFMPAWALFLQIADDTVFWSYSWWYDVHDGYYPDPTDPGQGNSSSAPSVWYPQLGDPLGRPLGPFTRVPGGSGWLLERRFENAMATIDLADFKSGIVSVYKK